MSTQIFDGDATFSLVIPRQTITVTTTYPGVRANVIQAPTCFWCPVVSAVGATGTYTFALQVSDLVGGTYLPIASQSFAAGVLAPHQLSIGVSAAAAQFVNAQAAFIRAVITLGGSSPSLTLESCITKPGGHVGLGVDARNVYAAVWSPMEDWMHYDRMMYELFQQPGAYPYPFGSHNLQWLYDASDERLRQLSYPRLRDQAVSVDYVFAEWKGRYMALLNVMEHQGMTPYLEEQIIGTAHALRRIQAQQRRLRALLDEAPQPRQVVRN